MLSAVKNVSVSGLSGLSMMGVSKLLLSTAIPKSERKTRIPCSMMSGRQVSGESIRGFSIQFVVGDPRAFWRCGRTRRASFGDLC